MKSKRSLKQKGGQACLISYCTVSTKDTPELQRLKKSAEKYEWKLDVLGMEQNSDKFGWGDGGNFSIKLIKQIEYVATKNYDDIVLFTDAWDVICIGNCATLYEKFMSFNKDLVFGAEKMCAPDEGKASLYKTENVEFKYLNSGFFIGKAGVIKKYLEQYKNEKINDQLFWTNIYLENQDAIALDTNATLVLNLWDTDMNAYKIDNGFTYTITNTQPVFIHANGLIKERLNLFTHLLQGGYNKYRKNKMRKNKTKKTRKHLRNRF